MACFYSYLRMDMLDFQWPRQLTRQLESFNLWAICPTSSALVCLSANPLVRHPICPSTQPICPHSLVRLFAHCLSLSTRSPVHLSASPPSSAPLPVRPPASPVRPHLPHFIHGPLHKNCGEWKSSMPSSS